MRKTTVLIEWPTLALFAATYAGWGAVLYWDATLFVTIPLIGVLIALHGSLQHEAIHGHPFRAQLANTAVAWPPLTLVIPFLRFRDTHLDHHQNCDLTDPFEDPESNYCSAERWHARSKLCRGMLELNNTLAGRLLVGPAIGTVRFLASELQTPAAAKAWIWHVPAAAAVLAVVLASPMPLWAYLVACYLALALLRIRTFLEHQAHEFTRARSVIIEDRGPLAFLFLNNNLHAVHHAYPQVPWYRLPDLYRRNKARFLKLNEGYAYRSYGEVFRRFLLRRKDPVVHPLQSQTTSR